MVKSKMNFNKKTKKILTVLSALISYAKRRTNIEESKIYLLIRVINHFASVFFFFFCKHVEKKIIVGIRSVQEKVIGREIRFCSLYSCLVDLLLLSHNNGGRFLSFWNFDKTKPLRKWKFDLFRQWQQCLKPQSSLVKYNNRFVFSAQLF